MSTSSCGFGWTLADLHGNIAGYAAQSGGVVTDATRYDPYGEVVAKTSSGLAAPWGYQGRLDLAGSGDTDLLDFGFRPYAPDLGAFTSPDDLAGSALNPLTFNRYLYAGANPQTLVDPDGHCPQLLLALGGPITGAVGVGTCIVGGLVALFAGAAAATSGVVNYCSQTPSQYCPGNGPAPFQSTSRGGGGAPTAAGATSLTTTSSIRTEVISPDRWWVDEANVNPDGKVVSQDVV